MNPRPNGFTLIEVLVAFTILALSLATLMRTFSTGLRSLGTAEQYAVAALQARSKLAELGSLVPLEPGSYDGELDNGTRWAAVVEPYEIGTAGNDNEVLLPVYSVDVTVSWSEEAAVSLRTLRIGKEQ